MEDINHPLRELFASVAASAVARQGAVALASLQAEHYRQLIAEGLDEEIAVRIVETTSRALMEACAGITANAPAIAQAGVIISKEFGDKTT